MRRTRAALFTGLLWGVAWAPLGILAALLIDPANSHDEPWLLIFAMPGFFGGVLFSAVLAREANGRSLLELSTWQVGRWGAAAGLLTGALPICLGESAGSVPAPILAAIVMGTVGSLSALSAAVSLRLAQHAARRALAQSATPALAATDTDTR